MSKEMLIRPGGGKYHQYCSDEMIGVFKFAQNSKFHIGCTVDYIAEAATRLRNENPGGGEFIDMHIAESAKGEYGLRVRYRFGQRDLELSKVEGVSLLDTYIDFWQRNFGLAYKGYEGFRGHVVSIKKPRVVQVFKVEGKLHASLKNPSSARGLETKHEVMILRKPLASHLGHTCFKCVLHDGGDLQVSASSFEFWAGSPKQFAGVAVVYINDPKFELNLLKDSIENEGYEFQFSHVHGDLYIPQISLFT